MKTIFYLVVLLALGYGIYYLTNQDEQGAQELNETQPKSNVITVDDSVTERREITKSNTGKSLCKTYTESFTYSYSKSDGLTGKVKAKMDAKKKAILVIDEKVKAEKKSLYEARRYYKDALKQLSRLPHFQKYPVEVDAARSSARQILNKALANSRKLTQKDFDLLETKLTTVIDGASSHSDNKYKKLMDSIQLWHSNRAESYPILFSEQ